MIKQFFISALSLSMLFLISCEKEESFSEVSKKDLASFKKEYALQSFHTFYDGNKSYGLDENVSQIDFEYIKSKMKGEEILYYLGNSKILYVTHENLSMEDVWELDNNFSLAPVFNNGSIQNAKGTTANSDKIGWVISSFDHNGKHKWTRSNTTKGTPANFANVLPDYLHSKLTSRVMNESKKTLNNVGMRIEPANPANGTYIPTQQVIFYTKLAPGKKGAQKTVNVIDAHKNVKHHASRVRLSYNLER